MKNLTQIAKNLTRKLKNLTQKAKKVTRKTRSQTQRVRNVRFLMTYPHVARAHMRNHARIRMRAHAWNVAEKNLTFLTFEPKRKIKNYPVGSNAGYFLKQKSNLGLGFWRHAI
jgi:hypothetical protein